MKDRELKYKKQIPAGVLTIVVTATAAATPLQASAAESTGGKEEVVYVMTDAGGNVENVDVVNIFGKGDVTDYGDYSSVKMLTSTEPITQDGDKITFTTGKEKVYTAGISSIVSGYGQLTDGAGKLVNGSKELLNGSSDLKQGTVDLHDGTVDLYDGTVDLCDGTVDLYDGTNDLYDGTVELQDGTKKFYDKTYDMDTQVREQIDDMLAEISGSDAPVVSFVSGKNENVNSVQFVIKTAAIEKEEVKEVVAEETPTGFFQKLLALFRK